MTEKQWMEHPFVFKSKDAVSDFKFALGSLADLYNELQPKLDTNKDPKDCVLTYNELRVVDLYCRELRKMTSHFELKEEDYNNGFKRFEE